MQALGKGTIWAGTPQHRDLILTLLNESGTHRASTLPFLSERHTLLGFADAA